jgi:hypothetical protein
VRGLRALTNRAFDDVPDLTQARRQAILDTALDAIVCIDRTGAMTVFNRAAEACSPIGRTKWSARTSGS